MRETEQRRAPHYGKRLLHFFRHGSDPLRIKTILGLSLPPAMFAYALCVGCSTQPDNVLSIPSPANGQPPPPEVVAADTEANGTFIATSSSTQGLWKMKSGIINGTGFPSSLANSTTLLLRGENYEVVSGGVDDKGTCVQDLSATPFRMTIQGVEGSNAGKTILAIFEMPSESTLRVCYDLAGADFPSAFESTAENGYFYTVYTRQP